MNTEQNVALEAPDANQDQTLALLKRPEITAAALEKIAKDPATSKSRKIKLALIGHLHTPRHVSLFLLRSLYTF